MGSFSVEHFLLVGAGKFHVSTAARALFLRATFGLRINRRRSVAEKRSIADVALKFQPGEFGVQASRLQIVILLPRGSAKAGPVANAGPTAEELLPVTTVARYCFRGLHCGPSKVAWEAPDFAEAPFPI